MDETEPTRSTVDFSRQTIPGMLLLQASEIVSDASETVSGELRDRLQAQAEQLANLAEAERQPDPGRLGRHQQQLRSLEKEHSQIAPEMVRANEIISEYRELVE